MSKSIDARLGKRDFRHPDPEIRHMKKILYLHGFASSGASGDEDNTVLADETRPVFEQHYPGMSQAFHGGHRMNAHIVVHTLLPFIKGLGLF